MKLPYKSYPLYALIIPAVTIIADQLSKYAVLDRLHAPHNICEINPFPGNFEPFSPIFDLALVCNQGISFGLLGGDLTFKRWLLTLFAALMSLGILYVLTKAHDNLSRLGLALVLGGAIGNAIDRFQYGAVIDFISVKGWLPVFPWVFNVADSAITCGVIALLLSAVLSSSEPHNMQN